MQHAASAVVGAETYYLIRNKGVLEKDFAYGHRHEHRSKGEYNVLRIRVDTLQQFCLQLLGFSFASLLLMRCVHQ